MARWPAPSRERIEPLAVEQADRWPAWGHRKIAALIRADGHDAPDSTVLRALRWAGRVLPIDYQAEPTARRGAPGRLRGAALGAEPGLAARLHRVRDETRRHLAARRLLRLLVEDRARLARLHHRQPPRRDRGAVELAISETERLLEMPLAELLLDPASGEIRPIALVTDNGPCFKAARFAAFIEERPELSTSAPAARPPSRTAFRERAFGSLKYEHLYRLEIDDGVQLAEEAERYRHVFNAIRPHEALGRRRPLAVHLEACQHDQTLNSNEPELLPAP